VRGRGLLTTGVSSKLTGVSSELTGVSSELTGVSSKLTGVSSEIYAFGSDTPRKFVLRGMIPFRNLLIGV
jgi:hypothetical protein